MKILLLSFFILSHSYARSIKVMSYNVENLFDTLHDKGKNDYEFLPKSFKGKKEGCLELKTGYYKKKCLRSNWTKDRLELKLEQIKEVVSLANFPEIIALSEVENERVVRMLAKKLGYIGVAVSNSLDARGVDVALLYKEKKKLGLTLIDKKEVKIDGTRSLLRVTFKGRKRNIHIFVNHWPSQGSPAKRRLQVSKRLGKELKKINKKDFVMIMGDFNTLDRDQPHPFRDGFNKKRRFIDLSTKLEKGGVPGTYFYGREMAWNMFDRIFVSKNMKNYVSNYSILSSDKITGVYEYIYEDHPLYGSRVMGIPKRYNFRTSKKKDLGYSDHFPVIVDLKLP